jgi:chemotaxis signal transduction protein
VKRDAGIDEGPTAQLLAFRVATGSSSGLSFGLYILQVEEVLRRDLASADIDAGAAAAEPFLVRGRPLPLVDLRERLRVKPRAARSVEWIVVARVETASVGLCVDEVKGICSIALRDVHPPHAPTLERADGALDPAWLLGEVPAAAVQVGFAEAASEPLLLLDVEGLLTRQEWSRLSTLRSPAPDVSVPSGAADEV